IRALWITYWSPEIKPGTRWFLSESHSLLLTGRRVGKLRDLRNSFRKPQATQDAGKRSESLPSLSLILLQCADSQVILQADQSLSGCVPRHGSHWRSATLFGDSRCSPSTRSRVSDAAPPECWRQSR